MTDVFSKQKRSEVMAAIRSSGNKDTELKLIAIFRAHGITGWRRRQRLPGKPDFVFHKERLAVFVDGCFWHGCPEHYQRPAINQDYWRPKLEQNLARDAIADAALLTEGWTVIHAWEHEDPEVVANRVEAAVRG